MGTNANRRKTALDYCTLGGTTDTHPPTGGQPPIN